MNFGTLVDVAQSLAVGYGLFLLYWYRGEQLVLVGSVFFVASLLCIILESNERAQKVEASLYALLPLALLAVKSGWDGLWAVWLIGVFLICVNSGTIIIPVLIGARKVVGKD